MLCAFDSVRRQTTVDLRYVPVSVAHDADGTEVLSLLAILVISRGRLQPEMMDPGLPRDAGVYPLTTPGGKLSARFCRLSTAAEARFSFGIEWCHTTTLPEDGGSASSETPPLRLIFRATSASDYARWKQMLGAALALPLTRIPMARAIFDRHRVLGELRGMPIALQGIDEGPATTVRISHGCNEQTEAASIDDVPSSGGDSNCEGQCCPRFKCSQKSGPRLLNSSRLQLHASLDIAAQHPSPTQRAYRKSSSLSHIDVNHKCSEVESSKRIEPRINDGITTHSEATSAETKYHKAAYVQVDVQAIIGYFELFSESRVLLSGLEAQQLVRAKRRWRSAYSMPASSNPLRFSESDGFSWRATPALELRQQRYKIICQVNHDIERRIRALTNDATPQVDDPDGTPVLLPRLVIQPTPPSTRSTFEAFCCQ
jgi:hypothetical protein